MSEPRLANLPAFNVLGVEDDAFKIDDVDPGFHDLWMRRFMAHDAEVGAYSTDGVYYAVWFGTRGTDISVGTYLAGMAVRAGAPVPEGWVLRQVPSAEYAVFDTTLRDVGDATEHALDSWLPASDYVYDGAKPRLDYMGPGTEGQDAPVSVWIPVRRQREV